MNVADSHNLTSTTSDSALSLLPVLSSTTQQDDAAPTHRPFERHQNHAFPSHHSHTMTRAQSHVSTWLSLGDLLLTLGKSYTELDDNYEVLQRPDAHPNLHFVKPTINHAVADFGLDLAGYRLPPILRPSPSLLPECRKEQLRRVHAIPLEERLWCFSVLTAAYVTIKNWVRKSLDDGAVAAGSRVTTKTLAPTVGHLLHIDRLESCEPHRVELPFEHCSDMRLAFNIVVHIHAHSKLAQFFATEGIPKRGPSREEAPVSFQSPDWNIQRDPSTWGFELYSTQAWDETLAEWDGRIEQKILKQSVIVVSLASVDLHRAPTNVSERSRHGCFCDSDSIDLVILRPCDGAGLRRGTGPYQGRQRTCPQDTSCTRPRATE